MNHSPVSPVGTTRTTSSLERQRTFDLVVQSCAVALLHSYDVAAAPVPKGSWSAAENPATSDATVLGEISFSGVSFSGTLEIGVPESVLRRIGKDDLGVHGVRGLSRELANQLMGRIKNKLIQFQVNLQVGVPTSLPKPIKGGKDSSPVQTRQVYQFRTRQGVVEVTLTGKFDLSALVFSNHVTLSKEGDVVLF